MTKRLGGETTSGGETTRGKRLGGKRLGGETTRGRNGLGAKRPGFMKLYGEMPTHVLAEYMYIATGDSTEL